MAVENERIIEKMLTELQRAKAEQQNQVKMKRHLANVQVLCELILEEGVQAKPALSSTQEITADEMKAMIGNQQTKKNDFNKQQISKTVSNHKEDTGGSLFDF